MRRVQRGGRGKLSGQVGASADFEISDLAIDIFVKIDFNTVACAAMNPVAERQARFFEGRPD